MLRPRPPVADWQDLAPQYLVELACKQQVTHLHNMYKQHRQACRDLSVSYLQSSRHLGPHLGLTANRSRKPGGVPHRLKEVTSCCYRFVRLQTRLPLLQASVA